MITNLLSSHRRNRHQKLMPTMSPASAIASGNLTPYSNQQLYAKLSFKDQSQLTSNALEHMNGDYHCHGVIKHTLMLHVPHYHYKWVRVGC